MDTITVKTWRRPSKMVSAAVCVALVAVWAMLRLALFRDVLFPLTFAIPLTVCIWTRSRLSVWLMAAAFGAILVAKVFWVLPAETTTKEQYVYLVATLCNIVIASALIHALIGLLSRRERLTASLAESHEQVLRQNEELTAQSEELTQQNEELAQQNEEIQTQREEMETQNEELRVQGEEIQALNEDLQRREKMLLTLLRSNDEPGGVQEMTQRICASVLEVMNHSAEAVLAWHAEGGDLVLVAAAGCEAKVGERHPLAGSFAGLVMEHNRTACIEDTAQRPDLQVFSLPGEAPFRAVLGSPLMLEGKPAGAIAIYSKSVQRWTAEQFRLAQWLAGECSEVLEGMRLRSQRRQAEERVARFFEISPDLMTIAGFDGHLKEMSPSWEKTLGWTREELSAKPWLHFVHPDDHAATIEAANRLIAGERIRLFVNRYRCRDGTYRWIEWHAAASRELGVIYNIARDITERKQREESLQRATEELRRSNQELEQFAYIASHDLQEPLRMIKGFIDRLNRQYGQAMTSEARQYMAFATEGAERMSQLIRDVLSYSRVQTRKQEMARVNMDEVLAAALGNCRAGVQKTGAEVKSDKLPCVEGDATQLTQLLQNLVGNAVKFHRPDVRPEVHVSAEMDGEGWVFTVQDNGIGVPAEQADRVFQIFQRLHTREKYPGTGIGLAICRKIVERHGGRIWVEPAPEAGSRFRFTLPPAREAAVKQSEAAKSEASV